MADLVAKVFVAYSGDQYTCGPSEEYARELFAESFPDGPEPQIVSADVPLPAPGGTVERPALRLVQGGGLAARLAMCKGGPLSAEERKWIDAPAVGREKI